MAGLHKNGAVGPTIKAPAGAVTFGLIRLLGPGDRGKKKKVVGEPLENGTVPERWDVKEFSPAAILEAFGADHYRVDWYDAANVRIRGNTFHLAHPADPPATPIAPKRRHRAAPARERDDDDDRDDRRGGGSDTITFRELLAMQAEDRREADRREERAAQRAREEADARQQRDREFMGQILALAVQSKQEPAQSSDLLRRELQLEIRNQFHDIRRQLRDDEEDEPEADVDPPADLDEGINRVGTAILGELEQRAPHLVGELIPAIGDWLKGKGFVPSQELQDRLAGHVPAVNGRARSG